MGNLLRTVALVALASAPGAWAAFDDEAEAGLLSAFDTLSRSQNTEAAQFIGGFLEDKRYSSAEWQALFNTYFDEGGGFTAGHARFWDWAIGNTSGEVQLRVGLVSGLWAAEAIGSSLGNAASFPTLAAGFDWLGRIAAALGANGRSAVFSALDDTVGGRTIAAFSQSPQQYGVYVQYGLTLRDYATGSSNSRATVSEIMGFSNAARQFWESRGVLLFDNGALDAAQLSSLDLLLTVIPSELHNIGAFIVPDATAVSPGTSFTTPVQIVFLELIPTGVTTNPEEFPQRIGQPVASLFTVTTAASIVRAVQSVQFARRPELQARRDMILANARGKRERFLRRYQILPPGVYYNDPDALLPSVAYPYFIDSSRAFAMGMLLFELEKQEAIDSFLLLADMLSGGSNTTILYSADPLGRISHSRATLSRLYLSQIRQAAPDDLGFAGNYVPANFYICNGIAINGFQFLFEPDPQGISLRVHRR
jgi:hypothetical protein